LGFAAFRLFDIWKPWPISWLDRRVHGGTGIMVDDLVAGIFAAICLQLLYHFFPAPFVWLPL
jgi:phosphatidylglycerophosphatase A